MKPIRTLLLLLVFWMSLMRVVNAQQFTYPNARKEIFDTTIFNQKIQDEYFWMSKKENEAEMLVYGKEQGNLAKQILDSIPGSALLQKQMDDLFMQMESEIWRLTPVGKFLYYYRYVPGKGNTLCRRKIPNGAEEELLSRVRINGQAYSMRKMVFAYHQPLVAMMLTQGGDKNPQIRIFDLDKKEFLKDSISSVMFNDSRGVSMNWSPDDRFIFYTISPLTELHAEKYFRGQIKQHTIGTSQMEDKPIFGFDVNDQIKLAAQETPYIYSFKNSPYLIARIRSGQGENYAFAVHYSKLNGAKTPWIKLKNYINLGDGFDANDKWLYAATKGADRYRIVKIDMSSGKITEEFLPEQNELIAATDAYHNKAIIAGKTDLYVLLRQIGSMKILKINLKTRKSAFLLLASGVSFNQMALMNDNDLLFCQSSAIKSDFYQYYDAVANRIRKFEFADSVLDKSEELNTDVIWIPSRDGKEIPVSVVYAKTTKLETNNAWLIEGYGNAGASRDMYFDPAVYPWIKQGGVYAYAHVRGGGELGEDWYKDGQYPHKMNSVNDIVDIASWLDANNYSSASKIVLMGASAGSFLVGNAINQRPDLFAAGIYIVGLPDLALHTDAAGGREEKSIGPKNTAEGFLSNYQQSALYHIPQGTSLPGMLVIHGASDYILAMHPAARYVAKLQNSQKGDRPIVFMVNWEGGHSTVDPDEPIKILKFALWQTGHPDFQPKEM